MFSVFLRSVWSLKRVMTFCRIFPYQFDVKVVSLKYVAHFVSIAHRILWWGVFVVLQKISVALHSPQVTPLTFYTAIYLPFARVVGFSVYLLRYSCKRYFLSVNFRFASIELWQTRNKVVE